MESETRKVEKIDNAKLEKLKGFLDEPRTYRAIRDFLDLKTRTVSRYLQELRKQGDVYRWYENHVALLSLVKPAGGKVFIEAVPGGDKAMVQQKDTGITMTVDEDITHTMLSRRRMTIGEISRELNKPRGVSKEYVYKVLQSLRDKGFDVNVDDAAKEVRIERDPASSSLGPLELEPLYRHRIKFGLISDQHLGSRFQQLTLLHTAYKIFDEEKVEFVINAGDVVDGIKMYPGQEQEVFLQGADDQRDYVVENYPESKKYKTYIIAGNHDMKFKKLAGYNILRHVCEARNDLVFKGEVGSHAFRVKNLTFEVLHPSGGLPYAKSYKLQKLIEGGLGDIINRLRVTKDLGTIPQFFISGHLHIANYTPHLGVRGFILPCLQSQTPYLLAKGLAPELGIWILTVECDNEWNVTRILHDHREFNAYVKENDF